MAEINKLESIFSTSVKFYSSLTRDQALGKTAIGNIDGNSVYVEPSAICFVSDSLGNSIYLNKYLFGDGAKSGSSEGGSIGGLTEVKLSDIVVIEKDGQTLKTLNDYFNADGSIISENLIIIGKDENGNSYNAIEINPTGIKIGGLEVATQNWVDGQLFNLATSINNSIAESEQNSKDYAKSILTSVYKVKGTIASLSDLYNIASPEIGDVYNIGSDLNGANYVYTANGWDALGGSINFDNFYSKSDVDVKLNDTLNTSKTYTDTEIDKTNSNIQTLSTAITTINGEVQASKATIQTNTSNIQQNSTNITNIATQLTWQ